MIFRTLVFSLLLALSVIQPDPASARNAFAQTADATLHILRPIIHAEQDRAELCLEADHPLDETSKGRGSLAFRLELFDKRIPSPDVSISSTLLCLPGLEHRKTYRVTIASLRGANNEKLVEPYQFSFTVPDRHPSLAFLSDLTSGGLLRWRDNDPVLRAINVPNAKIELYRITDLALMLEAWRQHRQTTLAPSESAYFARNKGQLVWQGDVALSNDSKAGSDPNKVVEQKLPLHDEAGALTPGFYLVIASAPQVKEKKGPVDLAPLAAAWLLRSDLKIRAIASPDGYTVTTQKFDATAVAPGIRILLDNHDQKNIADAVSDANGIAALPLNSGQMSSAATMIGVAASGDSDFIDLSPSNKTVSYILPPLNVAVSADQAFYGPGTNAHITVTAHDVYGHPAVLPDSQLQILRADRSLYQSLPLPKSQTESYVFQVTAPPDNGLWTLSWQKNDGTVLAENKLRVTDNPDAPILQISTDPTAIDKDQINLSVKSFKSAGPQARQAAPFISGAINAAWASDDSLAGWEDYHFGTSGKDTPVLKSVARFITDDKGMTTMRLALPAPGDDPGLRMAVIEAQSDATTGAIDPEVLRLPVKAVGDLIGIRPSVSDARFAENSLAHFDIIAVNGDGKRASAGSLNYQIIEEGRSFDWYQSQGRWDYKPQQQRRRIGGGTIDINADIPATIDWPVTAGTYLLEISNASGTVVARLPFSAGWGSVRNDAPKLATLMLAPLPAALIRGQPASIRFKLAQPAIVTAIIADDRIREILQQFKAAGDSDIRFTPGNDWGDALDIHIDSRAVSGDAVSIASGKITLPLSAAATSAETKVAAVKEPLVLTGSPPVSMSKDDQARTDLYLQNNMAPPGIYHYMVSAPIGVKLSGAAGTVNLAAGQNRGLAFNLAAIQTGAQLIRLDITGPHNFHDSRSWTVLVKEPAHGFGSAVETQLASQQSWTPPAPVKQIAAKTHPKLPDSFVLVSTQPLFDAPRMLAEALSLPAFRVSDIAGQFQLLRLWHDPLLQLHLISEPELTAKERGLMLQLLQRQKPDGSFAELPNQETSLASTAAALVALAQFDQPLTQPATDQAVGWLKGHLNNNWFDEKERPERAAAYAALARAGKLDWSSLYYFGDTSANKNLPPLAAAQLAYAYSKNNDHDKAQAWIDTALATKNPAETPPELLPVLAENIFYDTHNLLPALQKMPAAAPDLTKETAYLRAVAALQNRNGGGRVVLNNQSEAIKNILILPLPEKLASLNLRNPTEKPLFIATVTALPALSAEASVSRRFYHANGTPLTANEALPKDRALWMVVEGAFDRPSQDRVLLQDSVPPGLAVTSCVSRKDLADAHDLEWLKNLAPDALDFCTVTDGLMQASAPRADKGDKNWRFVFAVEPQYAGEFRWTGLKEQLTVNTPPYLPDNRQAPDGLLHIR